MKDLVIFGTGGVGRYAAQAVEDINKVTPAWNLLGFLDDDEATHGTRVHGHEILGGIDWLRKNSQVSIVAALGAPAVRQQVVRRIHDLGHQLFATLIHPTAWIADSVHISTGSLIYPGVKIDCDASLGAFTIVNMQVVIGHDVKAADFVTVAPGVNIGGNVNIGMGCDLGIGSCMIQQLSIGEWTIVGAGAVVVRDLPDRVTAVGVPAKPIKSHSI